MFEAIKRVVTGVAMVAVLSAAVTHDLCPGGYRPGVEKKED